MEHGALHSVGLPEHVGPLQCRRRTALQAWNLGSLKSRPPKQQTLQLSGWNQQRHMVWALCRA